MHKRDAIFLLNLAHAVDHMFLLIFATAVATIGTVIAGTASPRFIDVQGRELSLQRRSYSHF